MVQERIRKKTGQTGFKFNAADFSLHLGSRRIFLENLYSDFCRKKGKDRDVMLDNKQTASDRRSVFYATSAAVHFPIVETAMTISASALLATVLLELTLM